MIGAAVLRALADAGATTEMIIAAVEASGREDIAKRGEEEARLVTKRAKDAERKREQRARNKASEMSRGQSVTSTDIHGHAVTPVDGADMVSLEQRKSPEPPKETQTLPKENPPKGGQKKGSRLPADWLPSEANLDDALRLGLPRERIPIEADKFRDWAISVAGQKGVKNDWDAAWRNWCRNATGPPGNGHYKQSSGSQEMVNAFERLKNSRSTVASSADFGTVETLGASDYRRTG